MKLFKWNTEDIKPKFSNVIESIFGKNIKDETKKGEEVSTVPSVNIAEEDKAFEVNIAVPGLEKKDVKIEIDNGCLVISSEKQYSKEDNNKNWLRREYGYASFQRIFRLPDTVDENVVSATMNNGVLNISIAKNKDAIASKKQISVS